jgi:uncharacterized protein YraI
MTEFRKGFSMVALVAGLVGFAPAVAAMSPPARTHWSTYLRAGPGSRFAVIDELRHDSAVTVRSCAHEWCEVLVGQTTGYINQDALRLPRPPAAESGAQACFVANQTGWRKPTPTRFCESSAGAR